MDIGLMMDCDYRQDQTTRQAFEAALRTAEQEDPRASVMPYYERLRQGYGRSAVNFENADRTARAAQLATLTYDEVLQERVVFGTPGHVTERLRTLQSLLHLSGFIIEPNAGGGIPLPLVDCSLRLFMQEVAPPFREVA